jgi:hypothetical protein
VLALGPGGAERPVEVGGLPPAYHGVIPLLNTLERRPAGERQATCAGLIDAARWQYPDVTGVAVDHVLGHVRTGPHDPPRPPSRRVRVQRCDAG